MRTDWQKREFAKECLEIEKAGGDVLAYIEEYWPSYTPRATWYNLQMRCLGRNRSQLTEGKPNAKIKRKEGEEMPKSRQSQSQTAKELFARMEIDSDAWKAFTEMGYTNPPCAMRNLKTWAKDNDQGVYAKLLKITLHNPEKQPKIAVPAPAEEKPVENPTEPDKAPEAAVPNTGDHISAKEFREMSGGKIEEGKPYVHPDSDYSTDAALMMAAKLLPVCAVQSRIKGEWHLSTVKGCVHLIWEDYITHEERSLGLPAEDWMKLAQEIPTMLIQLGLMKV